MTKYYPSFKFNLTDPDPTSALTLTLEIVRCHTVSYTICNTAVVLCLSLANAN